MKNVPIYESELIIILYNEFSRRFNNGVIPEINIELIPEQNRVEIFYMMSEDHKGFGEWLEGKGLIKSFGSDYVFLDSINVMRLFYSNYKVTCYGISFSNCSDEGIQKYTFSLFGNDHNAKCSVVAGNYMHAYVKAKMTNMIFEYPLYRSICSCKDIV